MTAATMTDEPEALPPVETEDAAAAAPSAEPAAPARKRPKPGERRVQILQALAGMLEQPGDLFGGGDPRGVDVPHARADLGVEGLVDVLEQLHLGTGGLDGGDVGVEAGDAVEEVLEDLLPVLGVEDLGVPLQPVEATARVLEGRHRRLGGGGGDGEALGGLGDGVAVGHPYLVRGLEALVQDAALDVDIGAAIFTLTGRRYGTAEDVVHGLEAVANAEDWDAELQQLRLERWGTVGIDGRRAAGQNKRGGVFSFDFLDRGGVGNNLGVDFGLAHAAGNKLRVLSAKVHNEDGARGSIWLSHAP